ncbi:response regulator [Sphingomonas sp. XXL09]|uniref:response regulator n=1 Tax=Sphingomonas sp. XXL09 TaxID=3457787 RepID=UPI00406BCE1C
MTTIDRPLVLVVEDQPLLRVHAHLALEEAGFAVIEAADAEEAMLRMAQPPYPVAVFTDIRMPGAIDGLQLAHRLRQARPDLTIVITSGAGSVDDDALPVGSVFLPKPYTAAQVARLLGDGLLPPAAASGASRRLAPSLAISGRSGRPRHDSCG